VTDIQVSDHLVRKLVSK